MPEQQDPRQSILAAAQRNDSYSCLQLSNSWLASNPDDHKIRLVTIGQFAQIGLCGPAVELAESSPGLLSASPELATAVDQLRSQPTGEVPSSDLEQCFERNFRAAVARWESLGQHEAALRESLAELELFRCADGNLMLSRKRAGMVREWLPAILHWERTLSRVPLLPETSLTVVPPYAIEGVGLGHMARLIFEGTREMLVNFTPRVHVFEPNPAQLAAWLGVGDHEDLIESERFHLWVGAAGLAQFERFCEQHSSEVTPKHVIRQPGWGPAATATVAPVLDRIERATAARCERYRSEIEERLEHRNPSHYADLFARRHRPLRIMGVTSRHTTFLQYSMRDIANAATALGHEFRVVMEESVHSPAVPRERILATIAQFDPDLILIIDHNRCEYDSLYDFPIPFCNWIQDDLPNLFGPGRGANLHPYDVVVGTIGSWRARQSGYPEDQWMHIRTPVSLTKFSNQPVADRDLRACACDLSFVSNLSICADQFLDQQRRAAPSDHVRRLLEVLFDYMGPRIAEGDAPGSPVQTNELTVELARAAGLSLSLEQADHLRQNFTDRLINIFFRHQGLQWASDLGLDVHLYGRGWENHPTLGKHAKGVADHGDHLRCIFQSSKLNLQAYPYSATHQRLLEGLAAGGAFIIRETPLDVLSPLVQRIERRILDLDIETEHQLLQADDHQLQADIRSLNERLYAPGTLYAGFVSDLRESAARPFRMEAGAMLPAYDQVRFATRAQFEVTAQRLLTDESGRKALASGQRAAIIEHFSYETALNNILSFVQRRSAQLDAPAVAAGAA